MSGDKGCRMLTISRDLGASPHPLQGPMFLYLLYLTECYSGYNAHAIVKSYKYTDTLQAYRHPTSIQTPYKYTDTLQVHRHSASMQTPYKYTDTLQVYRQPTSIQAPYKYTGALQVYRHLQVYGRPTSIQAPYKYTGTLQVYRRPTGTGIQNTSPRQVCSNMFKYV